MSIHESSADRALDRKLVTLRAALLEFTAWLDRYGESSQDQYDFWASPFGQKAKQLYYQNRVLGKFAVAPLVFLDCFLPATRRLVWPRQRFPIADAHFAMGFAYLHRALGEERHYQRARHFLNQLIKSRCPGYQNYAWGYPFQWMTNEGLTEIGTPLITTVPYVYEAFAAVHEIDDEPSWLEIMRSIAEHVANDYGEAVIDDDVRICSYSPRDRMADGNVSGVVNANAYRAFMLTDAARRLENEEYWRIAERNLNFVLQAQQPDGSWYYRVGTKDQFVDHFHTCFVLKALIKISRIRDHERTRKAIREGVSYYLQNLLDDRRLPKPFSKEQRATLYRRELYDYAESINLLALQAEEPGAFPEIPSAQLEDILTRWKRKDGSFRTRKLFIGWNNVPYHRWGQSQLFRSLALLYFNLQTETAAV